MIEEGALGFFYRGENVVAAPGKINLCVPGEVHTGQPATPEGWCYRMLYFGTSVLEQVAADVADRPGSCPFSNRVRRPASALTTDQSRGSRTAVG